MIIPIKSWSCMGQHLPIHMLCSKRSEDPKILVRLAQSNLVAKPNYDPSLNYLSFLLIPLSTNIYKSLVQKYPYCDYGVLPQVNIKHSNHIILLFQNLTIHAPWNITGPKVWNKKVWNCGNMPVRQANILVMRIKSKWRAWLSCLWTIQLV